MGDLNKVQTGLSAQNNSSHRSGHALAIWLLILGIVVGALGMWAYYSIFRVPSIVSSEVNLKVAEVKSEIAGEAQEEEFLVSGRIVGILEEESVLVLRVGQDSIEDSDGESYTVSREISFSFGENTLFKVRDSETGSLVESNLENLPSGKNATIRSDESITNYLEQYYAKEVVSF